MEFKTCFICLLIVKLVKKLKLSEFHHPLFTIVWFSTTHNSSRLCVFLHVIVQEHMQVSLSLFQQGVK